MRQTSFFILALLCLYTRLSAQAPAWQVLSVAVTSASPLNTGTAICTDASGNILMAGYYQDRQVVFGTYTLTHTNTTERNLFVVKYDTQGNVLWARKPGAILASTTIGISTDNSGNVLLTGSYMGTFAFGSSVLTTSNVASANCRLFIAKYDAQGNPLWAKDVRGNRRDFSNGICTDAGGNVFITGNFTSSALAFGSNTLTLDTSSGLGYAPDVFVAEYDPAGNVLWARKAGGPSIDVSNGINCDAIGNVYITGGFSSATFIAGSKTLANTTATGTTVDFFIAKYSASGSELWAKSVGGAMNESGSALQADAGGNIAVTGFFNDPSLTIGSSVFTNTVSSGYRSNFFVAKYDPAGNLLWANCAGGTSYTLMGNGLCTDAAGNIFVTGNFHSGTMVFGGITLTNTNTYTAESDLFVVKYNANGNEIWAKSAGGPGFNAGGALCSYGGDVFVTGHFGMAAAFDTDTIKKSSVTNMTDAFVARLKDNATSISDQRNEQAATVFPNPFTTQAILQSPRLLQHATATIYNSLGQIAMQLPEFTGQSLVINRNQLPPGLYFLNLQQQHKTWCTVKLVITD